MLRDLVQKGCPSKPQAVVTARTTPTRQGPAAGALVTRHLQYPMPYRSLFLQGTAGELAASSTRWWCCWSGCTWPASTGVTSRCPTCSSVAAPASFAAYLVDAETGELRPTCSRRHARHDVTDRDLENVFAELLDPGRRMRWRRRRPGRRHRPLLERYDALWTALTAVRSSHHRGEWRIEQWVESLNDLGFDIDEMDIARPTRGARCGSSAVVEAYHHSASSRR